MNFNEFKKGNRPKLNKNQVGDFFIRSCWYGHLDVAKWLWEISNFKIDIIVRDEEVIRFSHYNKYPEVEEWIIQISKESQCAYTRNRFVQAEDEYF